MVTKRISRDTIYKYSYVLAKIHMVTKHMITDRMTDKGYVLAKIHMVTKHWYRAKMWDIKLCSSKNPYGNKTQSTIRPFLF